MEDVGEVVRHVLPHCESAGPDLLLDPIKIIKNSCLIREVTGRGHRLSDFNYLTHPLSLGEHLDVAIASKKNFVLPFVQNARAQHIVVIEWPK